MASRMKNRGQLDQLWKKSNTLWVESESGGDDGRVGDLRNVLVVSAREEDEEGDEVVVGEGC
jgi:hypothetical protein